ncbi:MAG: ATP-binding cassette domain-containing protein [Pseudobdellovibrio sp.]
MSIIINKLFHTINNNTIFQDISLKIENSSFQSIVGLSGSGKSQLIHTIANLNNKNEKIIKDKKIRISFQNNNLIPWLSAADNVRICSTLSNAKRDELFKEFDLYKHKDKKPGELSGGMQQRLSLIRAFAGEADLLLLDEPFSMLDIQNKNKNQQYLMKHWIQYKPTILLVTHDIDEAIYFSQKVHFLSKTKKTIIKTYDIQEPYPRDYSKVKEKKSFQDINKEISQQLEIEMNDNDSN